MWELVVTSNDQVSCVIGPNERLLPSMTSIGTGVLFSTRANFYCHINSLSIKHVNALKSRSVWASIITNLLHLIMIGTKNMVLGLKISWDHSHYMMHQCLASWSLLILDMFVFWFLSLWIGNRNGVCCMWSMFFWTFMNNMTWFFTIQTKIVCTLALFLLLD